MNSVQFDQEAYKKLTPREIAVMKATAEGKTSEETAIDLKSTAFGVRDHRQRVREKIGAKNTAHAISILIKGGII